MLADLRVWVERLADRFALDTRVVPPCWEAHNGMLEALSALRDHERGSYAPDADPRAGVDWLHALREVRTLLLEQAALTQCTVQQHRDPPHRPPSPAAAGPAPAPTTQPTALPESPCGSTELGR
ncbi:hypothetical protein [Nostocoides sp. HKS02]|uniref:hypothetical protein n=1 Tax=Nostocoides sp. HKS02 TaxID=1813880 RepID=UPI0012B46BE0|nr:hypothetical protein [Tetrasphaera sp. HKS02]QGN58900.1 hypothetical protein GKE56_14515 [Tetrasphaera sp. HKS02]